MLAKLHLLLAGPRPNPFEGLYRFNSFDWGILIPYFASVLPALPRGSETLTFLDSAPSVEGVESVSI
jgi:hypothetical protein